MTAPARTPRRRWRLVMRLLGLLALIYAGWCGAVYFKQDSLIFPRDMAGKGTGRPPANVEVLTLAVDGGTVEAWLMLGEGRSREQPGPAVIFFHGNAELIDDCVGRAEAYAQRGYTVLLPEYRGYGRSAGTPSERAIVADAVAFETMLAARPEVDPRRMIYHGQSLGGGVAAQLAARQPPRALILQSTFTSVADMASTMGVPGVLCTSPFRTRDVLRSLSSPVLILHGTQDRIIPSAHAQRLADVALDSELELMPGDHNKFPADQRAYWATIDRFLSRAFSAR